MVTVPALLGDLIKRLAVGSVELDLAGQLSGRRALATRLQRLRSHLVVIGLRENETDAIVRALLTQLPTAKFIAVSPDGRSVVGYELRRNRIKLSNLSLEGLIDFIRAAEIDIDV